MAHSDGFTPHERHSKPRYLADRRMLFAVAYFGYAFCYLVRNNLKLTSHPMAEELGISPIHIGFILAAFTIAYAPGKLLMGMLADRTSMRLMLASCVAISSMICFIIPFLHSFFSLTLAMALLGLVQGAGSPAALGMLSAWYPNSLRGAAVTVWNTSQNLGAATLAVFAMLVLDYFSNEWRLVFWIPASISLIFSIWLFIAGKERPWQEGHPTLTEMYGNAGLPHTDINLKDSYWRLLWSAFTTSPVLLALLFLNALLYLVRFGVINWMMFYLPEAKGLSLIQAQNIFATLELMAIPMVIIFAFIAWKWPASMCTVGIVSMLVLAGALLLYRNSDDAALTLYTAALLGGLFYAPQVIVNILTVNLLPARIVGAAVGAVGLSGYLVGEVLANLAIPRIAASYGWDSIYLILALTALLTAVLYCWLRPYEKRSVILA